MAIFKCKMCGGQLEIENGAAVCECEYCGTQQTLPKTDNEQNLNMFNRANHFRQQCEFDKAAEIYERMTSQSDDAELFWSIVLCRYGIEYVDDPKTGKKIPTCHRTQYKSILEDTDYLQALNRADEVQRSIYVREAEYIDSVQKGILEISNREDPFDVFICYKESDEDGKRTQDSVIAQDLYYQLEQEGFKVFFSRITLESKLGTEYEPYIFAALNSAKVMVVVGTKVEYFNAVWVKNEWSRFLMLMQKDKSRTLIPAYKDIDPYDLPDALSLFQAQDMSKLGFMQDLIRGINKIIQNDEPVKKNAASELPASVSGGTTASLLKRASLFLEDHDWNSATEYCNKVLDIDPECAQAYFYMLLSAINIESENQLENTRSENGIQDMNLYKKAFRYADPAFKNQLEYYHKQTIYNTAEAAFRSAADSEGYFKAKRAFNHKDIKGFKDVEQKIAECREKALECDYSKAKKIFEEAHTSSAFAKAARIFEKLGDYKDAKEKVRECEDSALECDYLNAVNAFGKAHTPAEFTRAAQLFETLGDYRDSKEKVEECKNSALEYDYVLAVKAFEGAVTPNEFTEAENIFRKLLDYKDSIEKVRECEKRIKAYYFFGLSGRLNAIVIEKNHVAQNERAVEKLQKLKKDFEEGKYEGYQEKNRGV